MRADVEDAIDAALAPTLKDRPIFGSGDRQRPPTNEKTRGRFLDRLRVFLREAPQDLTLQELLEDLGR